MVFYLFFILCLTVTYLAIELLSRIFREMASADFSRKKLFEVADAQCRNYRNLLSLFFGKNFEKVSFSWKQLLNSWFDEIFFQWEYISVISTLYDVECVKIPSNQRLQYNKVWILFTTIGFTKELNECDFCFFWRFYRKRNHRNHRAVRIQKANCR